MTGDGHRARVRSGRIAASTARFGYLYSEEELQDWAGRIADLAARTATTHVLTNNCCADNSQRNAARLAELLGERGADVVRPSVRPSVRP